MGDKRPPMSRAKRFRILARDSFRCVYCGAKPEEAELHIDHLFPVCEGGDSSESNLVAACIDCNIGKRGQLLAHLSDSNLSERAMAALDEIRRVVSGFRAAANRELLHAFNAYDQHVFSRNDLARRCMEEECRVLSQEEESR